jgi:Glycosyl hydrolases family 25
MTVFGRDASNFDDSVNFTGLGFFTHKSTEGTGVVHDRFGARLNAARAAGVPVLGAYHVVRTGNLSAQLSFWLRYLDAHTPWWRHHPHWIMQIDAEKWPYDAVSASTVKQFAALVTRSRVHGFVVTYASRGQYGDTLRGIGTPLWNADYRGSSGGSYPGDRWTSSRGSSAGWAPYSGRTPVFLQYTDTPYDRDAYRGGLDQLRALTSGGTPVTTLDSTRKYPDGVTRSNALALQEAASTVLFGTTVAGGQTFLGRQLNALQQQLAAAAARETALAAAVEALAAQAGPVDTAAVMARIDQVAGTQSAAVQALQDEVATLQTRLAAAQADPVGPGVPVH